MVTVEIGGSVYWREKLCESSESSPDFVLHPSEAATSVQRAVVYFSTFPGLLG